MYDKIILNKLLDKYERSKHFLEPGKSNRRVFLNIDKRELPEYKYEDAFLRDAFNKEAVQLANKGILDLTWFKGSLQRLQELELNLATVDMAYAQADRVDPRKNAVAVLAELNAELGGCRVAWIADWLGWLYGYVEKKGRLPESCSDVQKLHMLVRAFSEYAKLDVAYVTMRAFSIRCFGNSKTFEYEVRNEFVRCATKHDELLTELTLQRTLSSREVLAHLGIYARPEIYELAGACKLLLLDGEMDIAPVAGCGIGINSNMLPGIIGFDLSKVKRIVFIENKTNYDEFLLQEKQSCDLIIYHGGILSPAKRKLFQILAASTTDDVGVFFWGDIDLGGFRMFADLQTILPQVLPWRMDAEYVRRFAASGLKRTEAYWDKLRALQSKEQYALFKDVIESLLAYGVTIEQEAFLEV